MFEAVRQIIETRIFGSVGEEGPNISFPMFVEGRQFKQPTNGNWGVLIIEDAAVVGRTFSGNHAERRSGSVRIKLYAPHGSGTRLIRTMADELSTFLNYTSGDNSTGNGGTLFMKSGSLKRVSDDEDGYLSYNLDYIYDYYTS